MEEEEEISLYITLHKHIRANTEGCRQSFIPNTLTIWNTLEVSLTRLKIQGSPNVIGAIHSWDLPII